MVTNLAKPDIVAVEEVQDNNGATDDGVVAADQTLSKLTDAIIAAGGPHYDWREIDPVNDQDGGQPGGNIRVAFLFNPARVTFVDRGAAVGEPLDHRHVGRSRAKGKPDLTLSPGRIDPTNPVWTASRKPLVGEFTFNGKPVFVIANHFDAKLGDQNADGRFQFPAQSSAVQRAGQAQAEHDFVAEDPRRSTRRPTWSSSATSTTTSSAPRCRSCAPAAADGSGDVDPDRPDHHAPGRPAVHLRLRRHVGGARPHPGDARARKPRHYQVVHINSEYADQVSDHDPQVVRLKP